MTTPRYLALASRHPWVVRVALAAGCLSLVATSPPPSYEYKFQAEPLTFTTDLTPETPTRVYRISMRAEALGRDRVRTTAAATASVQGTIGIAALDQGAPTPFVAFDAYDPDAPVQHTPVNVLTVISKSTTLTFTGDCATFNAANPCVSSLVVELSRTDDGAGGGLVNIPWTLNLSSFVSKPEEPDVGPLDLPWTVTVEEM